MGFLSGYMIMIKKREVTGCKPVSSLFLSFPFPPSLSSFNTIQISQSINYKTAIIKGVV